MGEETYSSKRHFAYTKIGISKLLVLQRALSPFSSDGRHERALRELESSGSAETEAGIAAVVAEERGNQRRGRCHSLNRWLSFPSSEPPLF